MRIVEIVSEGITVLRSSGIENAKMEAQMILTKLTGKTKEWCMLHFDEIISEEDCKAFRNIIKRRAKGEPLQYLLGETYFMGLPFCVNENVLIPRADTEILVESVMKYIETNRQVRLLDMCTGSGCIAVSLKKYLKNAEVFAVDISSKALEVAQKNALQNQVGVEFILSDCFTCVPKIKFDGIISNPPYLTESEMGLLQKEVTYEPAMALAGGEDGLDFYRKIALEAKEYLTEKGILAFEIGYRQAEDVSIILREYGYKEIEVLKDYAGNQRVVIAKHSAGRHS